MSQQVVAALNPLAGGRMQRELGDQIAELQADLAQAQTEVRFAQPAGACATPAGVSTRWHPRHTSELPEQSTGLLDAHPECLQGMSLASAL